LSGCASGASTISCGWLLEKIEHAERKLLHAARDLVRQRIDHHEGADADDACERIARGQRDKAQQQRERRQLHEGPEHDQEPAQSARRVHLVGEEERQESALVNCLGEGTHELGIGDRIDQPARGGRHFVGKCFRQFHAAPRERHHDAEIKDGPQAQDCRIRRVRLVHQDAAHQNEAGHAHHVEAEDVEDRDGRLSRLLHLLAELACEIFLEVAGAVTQHVGEQIFLRERAHAGAGLDIDRFVAAIDGCRNQPDRTKHNEPRQNGYDETLMQLVGGIQRIDQMRQRERPERVDRRRRRRQRHHQGDALREMLAHQHPDERKRTRRNGRKRPRLGKRFRPVQHFIRDNMPGHDTRAR
jgi:hypothetical protein